MPEKGSSGSSDDLAAQLRVVSDQQQLMAERLDEMSTALRSIAGLEGVAEGMAQMAGYLEPLRGLAPPTVYRNLDEPTIEAIGAILLALGAAEPGRPPIQDPPVADQPVPFIGQPQDRPHGHRIVIVMEDEGALQ